MQSTPAAVLSFWFSSLFLCIGQVSCTAIYNTTAGEDVSIQSPCQSGDVGSFGKHNENGSIWINGHVLRNRTNRVSFESGSVIIRGLTLDDNGVYIWNCGEDYEQSVVQLLVKKQEYGWQIQPSTTPSGQVKKPENLVTNEICNGEIFNASCQEGHVISVESGRYGWIRMGRCTTSGTGFQSCSIDVRKFLEKKCSGRRACQFYVPDPSMVTGLCPYGPPFYMEASYSCVSDHSFSIRPHTAVKKLAGDTLNITIKSDSIDSSSSILVRHTKVFNCTSGSPFIVVFNSRLTTVANGTSDRLSRFHVAKTSNLDFRLYVSNLTKEDEGCYIFEESPCGKVQRINVRVDVPINMPASVMIAIVVVIILIALAITSWRLYSCFGRGGSSIVPCMR